MDKNINDLNLDYIEHLPNNLNVIPDDDPDLRKMELYMRYLKDLMNKGD